MILNLENIFLFMSSSERQNNGIIHRKSRKAIKRILEMLMKLWYELYYSKNNVLFKITS